MFGSEIKSLLEDPQVPREWRADAIDAYLTLLYIPAPDTIYRGIHKLPPAHVLVAERGRIRLSKYWDLEFTGDGDERREEEYLEELDAHLREAVRLRMISDVPLGAFLSGGIDSSTVVAYMVEASDKPPVTISVGFEHQGFDEVEHAETVARHLELRVPRAHRQPARRGAAAQAGVALRRTVRGLVSGADLLRVEGGAAARHRRALGRRRRRVVGRLHAASRRAVGTAHARRARAGASRVAGWLGQALPLSVKGARSLAPSRARNPDQAYALKHAYGMFEPDAKRAALLRRLRRARQRPRRAARASATPTAPARPAIRSTDRMYVDARTYMIDDVLTKVDRMSMAVSLEAREPLLDHKLLEFAARVPASLKLKNGRSKYLLRRVLERRVPRSIVERKKSGFAAPIGEWLRGPLQAMTQRAAARRTPARSRHLRRQARSIALWREHRSRPGRSRPPAVAARDARALVQRVHR